MFRRLLKKNMKIKISNEILTSKLILLCVFQDETVDIRQFYLSVAALSGFVSFKSLLHTAFTVSTAVFIMNVTCNLLSCKTLRLCRT